MEDKLKQLNQFMITNEFSEEELKQLLSKKKFMNLTLDDAIEKYKQDLIKQELSYNTIRDYINEVKKFIEYCNIKEVAEISQEKHIEYHTYLKNKQVKRNGTLQNSKITSTNKSITLINKFLKFIHYEDACIKQDRVQNASSKENVFTKNDFDRLVRVANSKADIIRVEKQLASASTEKEKSKLQKKLNQVYRNQIRKYRTINLMVFIFGTGIRDAEIEYLTVEALKQGGIEINNKGKTRTIPIPRWVKKQMMDYCNTMNITSGIIFHGRDKNSRLSHSQIWKDFQYLTGKAKLKLDKGHEHAMRRLFAKEYLQSNSSNDVKSLQDILGHEDISTTYLYLQRTFAEQKQGMENMKENYRIKLRA